MTHTQIDLTMTTTNHSKPLPPPASVSFWTAFVFWLKLGFISFGGPAGQISIMHDELVVRRRWISEKRFLHALNYCMVLPGPEAQQLATYLGWLMHRTWGGLVAGGLFVLPSLVILIALSWLYMAWGQVWWVAALFYGIKPAVAAIVLQAAYRIGSRTLKNKALWAIAIASFVAVAVLNVAFPVIVISAALVGYLGHRVRPDWFTLGGAHAATHASTGGAMIDDDTPPPAHARWSIAHLTKILTVGLLLWCIPMVGLWQVYGEAHPYTQMAWFFTKAAWLTFGGAYAVLPYVYQGAVTSYAWLTPTQMMDGLALGETTPGPLIMIVAFVGFVGGWGHALTTGESAVLLGMGAACWVTWFTFLPSFVLILAGAPVVESTRDTPHLTAPLTAITAAVVGVILNLALFFVYHIVYPKGVLDGMDIMGSLIMLGAIVALLRIKVGVIKVIMGCALIGLVYWMVLGGAIG